MNQFTILFTTCNDQLPEAEFPTLYANVVSQDDFVECRLDTSLVISRAEAKNRDIKPECETNAFPVCD
jgi:hypothetical protein